MSGDGDRESLVRLESLLLRKATEGLGLEEEAEVLQLLKQFPGYDAAVFERMAAACDIAFHSSDSTQTLPTALRRRLSDQGRMWIAGQHSGCLESADELPHSSFATTHSVVESTPFVNRFPDRTVSLQSTASKPSQAAGFAATLRLYSGWIVAACTALIALGWSMNDRSNVPTREVSLAERRAGLLGLPGTVLVRWSNGPSPLGAPPRGDVVWSSASQEGYMSFEGLPINDPAVEQYQLWIIDPGRDSHPIDGGVFDIVSDGVSIVPIDAKLSVARPEAFAITLEKPGGVVVSEQKRLPLIAALANP